MLGQAILSFSRVGFVRAFAFRAIIGKVEISTLSCSLSCAVNHISLFLVIAKQRYTILYSRIRFFVLALPLLITGSVFTSQVSLKLMSSVARITRRSKTDCKKTQPFNAALCVNPFNKGTYFFMRSF